MFTTPPWQQELSTTSPRPVSSTMDCSWEKSSGRNRSSPTLRSRLGSRLAKGPPRTVSGASQAPGQRGYSPSTGTKRSRKPSQISRWMPTNLGEPPDLE